MVKEKSKRRKDFSLPLTNLKFIDKPERERERASTTRCREYLRLESGSTHLRVTKRERERDYYFCSFIIVHLPASPSSTSSTPLSLSSLSLSTILCFPPSSFSPFLSSFFATPSSSPIIEFSFLPSSHTMRLHSFYLHQISFFSLSLFSFRIFFSPNTIF